MPPFSARKPSLIRASSRAASSRTRRSRAESEASSTRHSSQSSKLCPRTDSSISQSTSSGVSYTGVTIEKRGEVTLAKEALEQPHAVVEQASHPGNRNARRQLGDPLRALLDHRQPAQRGPEFGVAGDQQVAETQDLLVATSELGLEIGEIRPLRR